MTRRLILSVILPAVLFVASCGDDGTATSYALQKVDPKFSYGHDWLPLNPATYLISKNKVVRKIAGSLKDFEDCTVFTVNDWECRYSDGSGTFGFRNGTYWALPKQEDIKLVSRFEYNRVRCEWSIDDPYEGIFWGIVSCVMGWE